MQTAAMALRLAMSLDAYDTGPECSTHRRLTQAKPRTIETMMTNLAEALAAEQKRVRHLVAIYENVPHGWFGAAMLRQALERAEAAGDELAMLRSYEELKGCE